MAKHIMGGHVAIGQMPYAEGQYEQMFGRCAECLQLLTEPHEELCSKNPDYEQNLAVRQADIHRLFGDRADNTFWIAPAGRPKMKFASHKLLDSERMR